MENQNLKVAEVQLIYKTKVKAAVRTKIDK